MKRIMLMTLIAAFLTFPASTLAAGSPEFERILRLGMPELTAEAQALLQQRYPDEEWDKWKFPQYVYTSEAVETGYQIAVKHPELLRKIPCYCFCDAMGHKSLLDCFLKKGKVGGKYDEHAVTCNICYGQAMLALLWQEAGASEEEILHGMGRKFEQLVKERGTPAPPTR
ncbi:MAG: hypothetical protein IH614_06420 [Desulfuromonadales bacterium]|nr:hypothetical protein [Desulfuromonadales bacterium]